MPWKFSAPGCNPGNLFRSLFEIKTSELTVCIGHAKIQPPDLKNDYPLKALLVDDNLEYARMLLVDLERVKPGKVEVIHARSLQAALHQLNGDKFDIILLDLFLPDSQGYDTFCEVYNHSPSLPVVVLATGDDPALAIRLAQAGAQDYLIKNEYRYRRDKNGS